MYTDRMDPEERIPGVVQKQLIVQEFIEDHSPSAMDRVTVTNCSLGLLGLLLLQGVISVEGRSIFTSGNHVFNLRDDPDIQSKIFALLFHKTLGTDEKDDRVGMKLGNKLADLEELRTVWEDLELEQKISANVAEDKSVTTKRGEPCFWKYCV